MIRIATSRRAGSRAARLMLSVAAAASAVLVMCAGPAVAQSGTQDALVAEGQKLAAERCGRCHAIGARDVSSHPKAPPFRLVVERYPSENLAEALAEGIVAGHPDMPVIVLQPDEIEAFLAWLDSLGPGK